MRTESNERHIVINAQTFVLSDVLSAAAVVAALTPFFLSEEYSKEDT